MKRAIAVHLGDQEIPVGTLYYDQQGARESASFEYDGSWLEHAERFALAPDLPLVAGPQYHGKTKQGSIFHPPIADTEPDGWGRKVIDRDHAKHRQLARRNGDVADARKLNSLDYLLAVDDSSRMGALRFRDEHGHYLRAHREGHRTTPPLLELSQLIAATRAVEKHEETTQDLNYLRGRGTSLGGMRPKCSIRDDDGWLAIGKFPSVNDERAVTKGEVLALHLAKRAGIKAAEARVVDSDGTPVALIRRFDRAANGRRWMYISAASMLNVDPSEPGEHTYTELVDALRRHGFQPDADIEELWRRIAFSVLITNVDDHLLNHGFLHVGKGLWQLSPAFDINPFPERERELKTWVSEDTGPEATIDALMSVLPYFNIKHDRALTILAEVERSVAAWRTEGRALGLTDRELDDFADAFEHRERHVAQKLFKSG
jgi:serine/threonine-protein kinase HipA